MATTGIGTLFDLNGLETKPGRYGQPILRCPTCHLYKRELLLDGTGRFRCWECRKGADTQVTR